tara:strand:+ start:167 stop:1294 length:1128 start_codon:yes stop_codon:yes gene_type:complete
MTDNNTNIIDFNDTKEESKYQLVDFPQRNQKLETMTIEEFISLPMFPIQRSVEMRAKGVANFLMEPMFKHNEVDIAVYNGPTTSEPAYFKKGQMYVMDANTRQYIWKTFLGNGTVNKKITSPFPIPKKVIVNKYEFDDAHEAVRTYYTINSKQSTETKGHIVTGAMRNENLLNNFKNSQMKKGTIGMALDTACPLGGKVSHAPSTVADLENYVDMHGKEAVVLGQVTLLRDVLVAIDQSQAPGNGVFSTQLSLGMAMLAGKAMGPDNTRWLESVETLSKFNYGPGKDPKEIPNSEDGIYWIQMGQICNPGNQLHFINALPFKMGLFNDRRKSLDYLAHCWLCIMDNKHMPKVPTPKEVANKYSKLIERAWEEDDS